MMAELARSNKKSKASKSATEQTETRSGNDLQKMEEGTEGLQKMEEGTEGFQKMEEETDVKSAKQVNYSSGFPVF